MKSSIRNEIKAQIVRAGYTMQEVVNLLHDEYGWSDSVSNLSGKLQREAVGDREGGEPADVLGYEVVWQKRREAYDQGGKETVASKAPYGGSSGTGPGEGTKSTDKAAHSGGCCAGKSAAGSTGGRA